MRRASRFLGLAVLLCVCSSGLLAEAEPSRSSGSSLSRPERAELAAGQRVERALEVHAGSGEYVGGLAYQVVRAAAPAVMLELTDLSNLQSMLPNTLGSRVVARDRDIVRVEVEQGVRPFVARYTIVMQPATAGEVRFWLDKTAPHDIEDVWGFFRVTPFGKHSLLTVATAIDLGSGLVSALFKERVRALALRSATSIRDFVEPRCSGIQHLASLDQPGFGAVEERPLQGLSPAAGRGVRRR
ncbi:MAG TPA: hypothetical protein VFQ61_25120 [Polyangiaceae bacterium]|nr:hypothetical protein [Polyangiaceae bacterium]